MIDCDFPEQEAEDRKPTSCYLEIHPPTWCRSTLHRLLIRKADSTWATGPHRHSILAVGKSDYVFDPDKNAWLIRERGISFEQIIVLLENGCLIQVLEPRDPKRYSSFSMKSTLMVTSAHAGQLIDWQDHLQQHLVARLQPLRNRRRHHVSPQPARPIYIPRKIGAKSTGLWR
jgi:hypothetical protein